MLTTTGKSDFARDFLIILAASVLNSLSLIYVNFLFTIPAISLLLYLLISARSKRQSFYIGVVFGAFSSLLLNYWMIPVVTNYANSSMFLGIICYLSSCIVLGAIFGLQFLVATLLKIQGNSKSSIIFNSLVTACVWVLFEWGRAELFSAMPWLSFTVGITQGRSLFLIQPAEYGGVILLSFIIVVASYFVGYAVYSKNRKILYLPVGIIIVQYIIGYALYHNTLRILNENQNKLKVAILMPGLSPETVWNEKTANQLVSHLFTLNEKAIQNKPDLIVWTETIVPWTYSPNDDFIQELTNQTALTGTSTLIGMNTASDATGELLCNSAYLLDASGKESGRYDKQDLLTLVEKPLFSESGSLILPFLSSYNLKMRSGKFNRPIQTTWGKAGVMICNESTNSSLVGKLVEDGASYLINIGNNNWFSDYFITRQHFYNCRLRAIESRKDIIVNNNMGICGVVQASGNILINKAGNNSDLLLAEVCPNNIPSNDSTKFIYFITCIILIAIINLSRSKCY